MTQDTDAPLFFIAIWPNMPLHSQPCNCKRSASSVATIAYFFPRSVICSSRTHIKLFLLVLSDRLRPSSCNTDSQQLYHSRHDSSQCQFEHTRLYSYKSPQSTDGAQAPSEGALSTPVSTPISSANVMLASISVFFEAGCFTALFAVAMFLFEV